MSQLLIDAPLNSLSFGNVSIGILREFHKMGLDVGIFSPQNPDLSAFDLDNDFKQFLSDGVNNRFDFLSKDIPQFRLWHLRDGEIRRNPKQVLYTFYECNMPTPVEVSVAASQGEMIFSSSYSQKHFQDSGVDCHYIPIGFDSNVFKQLDGEFVDRSVTHFILMGKFERRKHTARIINTWVKKYGNDPKYMLTCCVTNPFLKPEQMSQAVDQALQGQHYTNVNILPYLRTNAEVNELLNSADIDLTGLSGGEGWNLPSFNATCLGKWSIVLNATAHTDWATKENSILVQPAGEIDVEDGVFFSKNAPFNHGTFYTWDEDDVLAAMEEAVKKAKTVNKEGLKLVDKFTYAKTAKGILDLAFGM